LIKTVPIFSAPFYHLILDKVQQHTTVGLVQIKLEIIHVEIYFLGN